MQDNVIICTCVQAGIDYKAEVIRIGRDSRTEFVKTLCATDIDAIGSKSWEAIVNGAPVYIPIGAGRISTVPHHIRLHAVAASRYAWCKLMISSARATCSR